jgi:hypothetical protein
MKDCRADHEIQRLHNELTMPVGEFGALVAAVLMSLSVLFVTPPPAETERAHRTAIEGDIKSHIGIKSHKTSAIVSRDRHEVSSAEFGGSNEREHSLRNLGRHVKAVGDGLRKA